MPPLAPPPPPATVTYLQTASKTKKRSTSNPLPDFSTSLSDLKDNFTQATEDRPPTENIPESAQEFDHMLIHGVWFINMWNTSLNKTTRPFLESFSSFYTRSIMWLFIDLERDLPIKSPSAS